MAGRIRLLAIVVGCCLLAGVLAVGTAAATPATAAADPVAQTTTDDGEVVDNELTDGGVYWQGQRLALGDVAADLNQTSNYSSVDSLHLRTYDTSENELGGLIEELDLTAGNDTLETATLDDTYVLLPANQRSDVLQFDNGSVNGTTSAATAEPFEIIEQTLTVEWEASPPSAIGSDRQLEIQSNRQEYNVNVSSDELNYSQLEAAFMGDRLLRNHNEPFGAYRPFEQRHRMYDTYAEDDVIVLRGFGDGALRPDFAEIDRFPGAVVVEVTDTGVRDTASLSTGAVSTGPFSITELSVSETVQPGEEIRFNATVENQWEGADTQSVVFELGESRNTVTTTLAGGESTSVTSTFTAPTEPGEYDYVVSSGDDPVHGTITVVDPTAGDDGTNGDDGFINIDISLQISQGTMGGVMAALSLLTVVLFRRR